MNEVPIGPDEYQARPRHMPPIFLSALAVMVLAFGGTLTIALPWNILDLINGREFQDLSRFQRFVWDLFAVFSFANVTTMVHCPISCVPCPTLEKYYAVI